MDACQEENAQRPANYHSSLRRARLKAARRLGTHTEEEWRALVEHYGGRCLRCWKRGVALTRDHVIPLCRAGASDAISNIQPLCRSCNSANGGYDIDFRRVRFHSTWYKVADVPPAVGQDVIIKTGSGRIQHLRRADGDRWLRWGTTGYYGAEPKYWTPLE